MKFTLSYLLFFLGDLASRIQNVWPISHFEALNYPIYRLYHRFMTWSIDIQGAGPGPWEAPADLNAMTDPEFEKFLRD